jgi:hypothetical protein
MQIDRELINGMGREEVVRLITEGITDMELLKYALDRVDELDGVKVDSPIAAINDEGFDDLPMEEQLRKLMEAAKAVADEAKEAGVDL